MDVDSRLVTRTLPDGAPDADARPGDERGERLLKLGRRSLLQALGAGGAVGLAACEQVAPGTAVPWVQAVEGILPGRSVRYASTCTACSAACGTLVTVRDARPIKLEGKPDHPLSGGGLCAVAQGDVRALYDARRYRAPQISGKDASWQEVDALVASGLASGKGAVYVLAPTLVSPSERLAVQQFVAARGGKLVEYDAGVDGAAAVLDAYELLDGKAMLPDPRLAACDLLVVLGADALGTGRDPVAFTAAYAARRRARAERDFRHVQVEGSLSLTGAASDERVLATASERTAFALALLRAALAGASGPAVDLAEQWLGRARVAPLAVELAAHAKSLGAALVARRGHALVLSGASDVAEQLTVALLNRLLGAEGATLDVAAGSRVRRGRSRALAELVHALRGKKVGALFVLGQNPVEDLPGGEALAELIGAVPLSVMLGERPTATARACKVVAAAHHGLERWGDAAPRADVLTLCQPTIVPLFDTRDRAGSLLAWAGKDGDYQKFLRAAWQARVLAGSVAPFELAFEQALAEGGVDAARAAAAVERFDADAAALGARDEARALQPPAAWPLPQKPAGGELELELCEEVGLRDGKPTFNPWLRELPDPLTRASWVATARIAPSRAQALGIATGDAVEVAVGDRTVELVARVLPGQHPAVVGVPVGYGLVDGARSPRPDDEPAPTRSNAFVLAALAEGAVQTCGLGAELRKLGRKALVPLIQTELHAHGREIIHQVRDDHEVIGEHEEHHTLLRDREYDPDWHMVIDLDACTGCSACVIACQAENNVPVVGPVEIERRHDMFWLRIDRYFQPRTAAHGEAAHPGLGDDANPNVLFQPMMCHQCGNAPCEMVCPVAATTHSHDGINQQVYNRCVGTRYCANNCPYKVRRFNWFDFKPTDEVERLALNPDVVVRDRGVMEKCNFCVQRIQAARIETKRTGERIVPETACQQSCPARAIRFGDAKNEVDGIAAERERGRAFQTLGELGVRPAVTYLARVRRGAEEGT
ncbi:MAG: 4Fe-4S dicluster domain-containing protein [Polyangiaceae bacterium]|nr:4Fe-4S dicluster domain-containing protein [Polyangiaceae bacterium]